MDSKSFLNELNSKALEFKDKQKEFVGDEDAVTASYIISSISITTKEDLVLFCLANNMLNAYVKQDNPIFGYYFKSSIYKLLKELEKTYIDGLFLSFQRDNSNTLLVISIDDVIQFSFHSIAKEIKDLIPSKYNKDIVWDENRKQKCSLTLIRMYQENYPQYDKFFVKGKDIYNQFKLTGCDYFNVKEYCPLPSYCFNRKVDKH